MRITPGNIVVLGGGFAGLRAALDLGRGIRKLKLTDRYTVMLIDRNQFHTFTPLLYEVATTTDGLATCSALQSLTAYPFANLLRGTGIAVLVGNVDAISLDERVIRVTGKEVHFDYVLFALGSETADFGIPGIREYALPLKTVADAIRIRDAVVARWHATPDDIDIVVAGGGPTGVELAGELRAWTDELRLTAEKIPDVHIRLVEWGETILNGFHPKIVAAATRRLRALDIEVRTGTPVTSVTANAVTIASSEVMPADLCVWTAGVQGVRAADGLPFSRSPRGRVAVSETLGGSPAESPFSHRIYIAGDASWYRDTTTDHAAPQTAPVAANQGAVAAHNILEAIAADEDVRKPHRRPFRLHPYPYILPIGGKYAIAHIGPFIIRGKAAWAFKGLVELRYLISIFPLSRAITLWLCGLRTFLASDRLG
ncbi:MAG: NAD(P)/FAD-dependent oxidoreductase [bacterium]|nr:NAD(P)/FAD-dependent oxidoreductase [bacterium]